MRIKVSLLAEAYSTLRASAAATARGTV